MSQEHGTCGEYMYSDMKIIWPIWDQYFNVLRKGKLEWNL